MTRPTRAKVSTIQALREAYKLATLVRFRLTQYLKAQSLAAPLTLLALVTPMTAAALYDRVYPSRDTNLLNLVVLAIVALGVGTAFAAVTRNYLSRMSATALSAEATVAFVTRLFELPISFFLDKRTGEVSSRTEDLQQSLGFLTGSISSIATHALFILFVPPVLLWLDWRLAIVSLASIPVLSLTALSVGRRLRRIAQQNAEQAAEANGFLIEALSSVELLKSMGAEKWAISGYSRRVQAIRESSVATARESARLELYSSVIRAFGMAVYTWVAWRSILGGRLTLGEFAAFTAYLAYLHAPLGECVRLLGSLQQSAVALDRFFSYYDAESEVQSPRLYSNLPRLSSCPDGRLVLRSVSFGYEDGTKLLKDVSAVFPAEGRYAIAGRSGSGKTSLLRVILRLHRQDSGKVLLGGRSTEDIPLDELRRTIAVVWQDPRVLQGTWLDNLLLGATSIDADKIERALFATGLCELLTELGGSIDSIIPEAGRILSGGQRQRIALARALVRGAPIILLDEATSQLDSQTEHMVISRMFEHYPKSTFLLTTHRERCAAAVESVFLLDAGKLGGGKTHLDLKRTSPAYRQVWDGTMQSEP